MKPSVTAATHYRERLSLYVPMVKSYRLARVYTCEHEGVGIFLHDKIRHIGGIEYPFYFLVAQVTATEIIPMFWVTSETNPSAKTFGTYYLGMFRGGMHMTIKKGREWNRLDYFLPEALEIIQKELDLKYPPHLVSMPNVYLGQSRIARVIDQIRDIFTRIPDIFGRSSKK